MLATWWCISSAPRRARITTSRRCGAKRWPRPRANRPADGRRDVLSIAIVAVGRHKAGPLKALEQFYAERIRYPLTIREVEERRKLPPAELKLREGELILAAL